MGERSAMNDIHILCYVSRRGTKRKVQWVVSSSGYPKLGYNLSVASKCYINRYITYAGKCMLAIEWVCIMFFRKKIGARNFRAPIN